MSILTIPGHQLTKIIRTIAPAASTDGDRPIMTGVLINVNVTDEYLTVVATDGYRLHRVVIFDRYVEPFTAIVPARWLLHWADYQPKRSIIYEATITVDDDRIQIEAGDDKWSTRLIAGEFPNYQHMFDADTPADEQSSFSPCYLEGAFEAAREWSSERPLRTAALNVSRPCKFTVDDPYGRLDILIMPVRVA